MAFPLLTTKLYMPPVRAASVPRPRLTNRLAEGLGHGLMLISAPAGFGKTTLLSEWRAAPGGRNAELAWLSLDAMDSAPLRFWSYVVAALKSLPSFAAADSFGAATLAMLEGAAGSAAADYLTQLINDMAALSAPFVLVLDDYHLIESPLVHEAVSFLLDHLPPTMRLVVLTRTDPPWPLARLRTRGQVAELRAADLRFTPDEAVALLNQTMGFDLSDGDVALLQQRTEGWIAALQMVALSLAARADRHAFVTAFAGDNRFVADYFAEEVIARQPERVQQFLLETAVLERLCAPLCDAVTGQGDGRAMLEQIETANLFLVPLDDERRWYRYHHLLADLLRARLQQAEPGLAPALHGRASRWYGENGFGLEATTHALAAGDYEQLAQLIEQNIQGWWSLAVDGYMDLLKKLPPEIMRSRPDFCVCLAWLHVITGQLDEALSLIGAAELQLQAGAPDGKPDRAETVSFISLVRKYMAELTGQPYEITALDLQAPGFIPERYVGMRNSADALLAFILNANGDFDRAGALLIAAAQRDLAANGNNAVPIATSRLARMYMLQGRLGDAATVCRQALAAITERGSRRFFINGNLNAVLADVLREQNLLDAAEAQAREGLTHNEAWGIPHAVTLAALVLARVLFAKGDTDGAWAALGREERLSRGRILPPDLVSERQALKVRLWLAGGDTAAAVRWAEESGLGTDDPLSFRRELEHMTLARVLTATHRAEAAVPLLDRLTAAAAAGGRTGRLIEILTLQAVALRDLHPERAVRTLGQALAAAAPIGFVRVFLDEGAPVAELQRKVTPRGHDAQQSLVEPLSERELEILLLMARGLSNREIAEALIVAVGTVKTHIHHICGKLDAQSRSRAVARARELGLLK